MSQGFSINGALKIDQSFDEFDEEFWSDVLKAAVYEPRTALKEGVEAAIRDYEGDDTEFDHGYLEGDEFDEETEEAEIETAVLPALTLCLDISLSGGYSVEEYIEDANNVVYRAGIEKGLKAVLTVEYTWLDRGPDDSVSMKWREMVEKFDKSA